MATGNSERDIGRLEAKIDGLQKLVETLVTKVDALQTGHTVLATVHAEQSAQRGLWVGPGIGALSGGIAMALLNWISGLIWGHKG